MNDGSNKPNHGLDAALLGRFRARYDAATMRAASGATLVATVPQSDAYVRGVLSQYDTPGMLAARDRERCIIALLAGQRSTFGLAVHIYWGMMEGLEPDEVANVLLLTGTYAGVETFALGSFQLRRVIELLGEIAERPDAELGSANVLREMVARFR